MTLKAVGEHRKAALMFDEDDVGRSGSEDAMARLVSVVYVKSIRSDEERIQSDTLSK